MRKIHFLIVFSTLITVASSQTISQKMQKAYTQFETDGQVKYATSSLYIIDAKTGKVLFDKNSRVGLAPASTQKIITSVTAFELLGEGYGYQTWAYFDGGVANGVLDGNFIIKATGDPTLGSPRYERNKRQDIIAAFVNMLTRRNITTIKGDVIIDERTFETASVPDGWIWQDIGNYYGAGAYALNWNENQYDMFLQSGAKENDSVKVVRTEPELEVQSFVNELKAGPKGSGDNAYIYMAPYALNGFVRGTIPPAQQNFSISGSFPYPAWQFSNELREALAMAKVDVNGRFRTSLDLSVNEKPLQYKDDPIGFVVSPSLAMMTDWFLKKSINLYGEAFIKTIAYVKKGFGSTRHGLDILRDFWKQKGLDENELNMSDGSGLSPQNRVTTHAQVEILKYAQKQKWYTWFYNAMPEYNGMKMKSGTIKDVKGYCGYHKSKDGKEYIFSFLVNNYNGSASSLVNKMYKVLDVLK